MQLKLFLPFVAIHHKSVAGGNARGDVLQRFSQIANPTIVIGPAAQLISPHAPSDTNKSIVSHFHKRRSGHNISNHIRPKMLKMLHVRGPKKAGLLEATIFFGNTTYIKVGQVVANTKSRLA